VKNGLILGDAPERKSIEYELELAKRAVQCATSSPLFC